MSIDSCRHYAERPISVIGSFRNLDLPRQFDHLFNQGRLTDPRNGTPMEMDGYSVYLALKAIEARTGADHTALRKQLVDVVISRLDEGFPHGAWTGSDREVHMRFTAAACRLLIDAFTDRMIDDAAPTLRALRLHLSYSEHLTRGIWFLHDSIEQTSFAAPHPHGALRSNAFGCSDRNCLVLNTHLDTLSTVLYALRSLPLSAEERAWLRSAADAGIVALALVLTPSYCRAYSAVDHAAREIVLRIFPSQTSKALDARIRRRLYRAVKPYFWLRRRFAISHPSFRYSDGYIDRDISLLGLAFEYHLVNVWDLCRFLIQLRQSDITAAPEFFEAVGEIIRNGLNYAITSGYWQYLLAAAQDTTRPILLCETILMYLDLWGDAVQPSERMIKAYCRLRRLLPPTAAILGHDPFVVSDLPAQTPIVDTADDILLRNGRNLSINIYAEQISFRYNVVIRE